LKKNYIWKKKTSKDVLKKTTFGKTIPKNKNILKKTSGRKKAEEKT